MAASQEDYLLEPQEQQRASSHKQEIEYEKSNDDSSMGSLSLPESFAESMTMYGLNDEHNDDNKHESNNFSTTNKNSILQSRLAHQTVTLHKLKNMIYSQSKISQETKYEEAVDAKRDAEVREMSVRSEMLKLEGMYKESKSRELALHSEVLAMKEQVRESEYLRTQAKSVEEDVISLRKVIDEQKGQLKKAEEREHILLCERDDNRKAIASLETQKEYMENELSSLRQKLEQSHMDMSISNSESEKLKIKVNELILELKDHESNTKDGYVHQLESEINKLREEMQISSTNEAIKCENQSLIKRNEETKAEIERSRFEISSLRDRYDALLIKGTQDLSEKDVIISECRNELKIKTAEVVKSISQEEVLKGDLLSSKLEVEHLLEQNSIIKDQFNKLESSSDNKIKQLVKELSEKEAQINLYHNAELELMGNNNTVSHNNNLDSTQIVACRVKQALDIGRENKLLHERIEQLEKALRNLNNENEIISRRLEASEKSYKRISKSSKPLTQIIKDQENVIKELDQECKMCGKKIVTITAERDILKEQVAGVLGSVQQKKNKMIIIKEKENQKHSTGSFSKHLTHHSKLYVRK